MPAIALKQHSVRHPEAMTHVLPTMPELSLSEVFFPDWIMDIGRFRIQGWKNEEGVNPDFFSKEAWIDDLDQRANHWIVTHDRQIVAAARLSLHESLYDVPYAKLLKPEHRKLFTHQRVASINRLVVDPAYRGLGLASILDRIRIERAVAQQADTVIAFPQYTRLNPLQRQGFVLLDQLENIPEMPERPFFAMALTLRSKPQANQGSESGKFA